MAGIKVKNATTTATRPATTETGTEGWFKPAVPGVSDATLCTPDFLNRVQGSLDNLIIESIGAGYSYDQTDDQVKKAVQFIAKNQSNVKQIVTTQSGEAVSTSANIPFDDTIPQITEGAEILTATITPSNAGSTLYIEVTVFMSSSTQTTATVGLFKGTTANALAAGASLCSGSGMTSIVFTHKMTAGSTAATTFKVRAGVSAAATLTINSGGSGRVLGGVLASSIKITETLL